MTRPARKKPTSRLTLELAQAVRDRIELLKDRTEAESISEVIRRALAVYELLWTQREKGNRVVIEGESGSKIEIILA